MIQKFENFSEKPFNQLCLEISDLFSKLEATNCKWEIHYGALSKAEFESRRYGQNGWLDEDDNFCVIEPDRLLNSNLHFCIVATIAMQSNRFSNFYKNEYTKTFDSEGIDTTQQLFDVISVLNKVKPRIIQRGFIFGLHIYTGRNFQNFLECSMIHLTPGFIE